MAGTPGSRRHLGCHSTDVGHRGEREGGGCVRRSPGIAHVWNTSTPPANPVKLLTHAAINVKVRVEEHSAWHTVRPWRSGPETLRPSRFHA